MCEASGNRGPLNVSFNKLMNSTMDPGRLTAVTDRHKFARDSPLERDGFEPSVPLRHPAASGFGSRSRRLLRWRGISCGAVDRSVRRSYWRGLRRDLTLDRDGGSIRIPGSFARICRSVLSRRDIGYWSASIIPVKRLIRAAGMSKRRSWVLLAPGFNSIKHVVGRRCTKSAENILHPRRRIVVSRLEA